MGEDFWDNFLPQPQDVARVQGRQLNGPHLNLADFPPGWVPGGFDDEIGEADFDDESEVEEEEGNNLPERDQEEANLGDNPVPVSDELIQVLASLHILLFVFVDLSCPHLAESSWSILGWHRTWPSKWGSTVALLLSHGSKLVVLVAWRTMNDML